MLEAFKYSEELANIPQEKSDSLAFYFNNGAFESGDAEYWYQMIRYIKPTRIFEIGSGNSTLMAINAIRKNQSENPSYKCEHICVEPYEMSWLEEAGVTVVREKAKVLPQDPIAGFEEICAYLNLDYSQSLKQIISKYSNSKLDFIQN
jgi:hypothetical protein